MKTDPQYLTITRLCQYYNTVLEQYCGTVYFEGEVSSVSVGARHHHYIKIKDQNSAVSAIIWGSYAQTLKFKLEVGQKVLCQGSPQIYPARGDLSTIITSIKLAGQGDLQQKFLELKEKLQAEGLFDLARKRKLPFLPTSIGIITSATGAVIHDMSVKFAERYPSIKIYLYDARVQGEGAYRELISGLQYFNQQNKVDLIILARGGGSLEDLWNFNEEALVRAIFASNLPVVSAVGHEPDISLSDLVADLRAPTPTAAAEFTVPKLKDLLIHLEKQLNRLNQFERWVMNYWQKFEYLSEKFFNSKSNYLQGLQQQLLHFQRILKLVEPRNLIYNKKQQLTNQLKNLNTSYQNILQINQRKFLVLGNLAEHFRKSLNTQQQYLLEKEKHLAAINPISILARGFSIVKKKGNYIREASEVSVNDQLEVQLAKGTINVIVK